jgi:hypothetical protein
MAWNLVPHHDPATGPRHPNHFSGHIKRLRREHGSKDAHNQIKRLIFQVVQIRGVTLLKLAVCETVLRGAPVSSVNQVLRNIHAQHVGSEPSRRQCGRYVDLIFITRALERIGDHATNIAEDCFWRDQATDIRHTYNPKKEF